MINTIKQTKLFYCMLVAYAFFAFVSPLSIVFIGIVCGIIIAAAILFDDNNVLCFLAFSASFMSCLKYRTLFLVMFMIAMMIICVRRFIINVKQNKKTDIRFIVLLILFTIATMMYSFFRDNFRLHTWRPGLGLMVSVLAIYFIDKVDLKKISLCLAFGIIVSVFLALTSYECGFLEVAPYFKSAEEFRLLGYFLNINALALYCALTQSALLTLFVLKQLDIKKWFPLLIGVFVIGLLTSSKTFLLISIITYMAGSIIAFIKSENKKRFAIISIFVALLLALMGFVLKDLIASVFNRFSSSGNYDSVLNMITTGRVDIWKQYLKKFSNSILTILFGGGLTADHINGRSAHNFYILLLYKFGIVGAVVLAMFIGVIIKKFKSENQVICYLPLLVIMFNGLTEDLSCNLYTCLPIVIALMFILKSKKLEK